MTQTASQDPLARLCLRWFLLFLILASLLRLGGYCVEFVRDSAQADFLAYFMAGRSLNHGLSPYANNGFTDPSLWDMSDSKHSRFLYPPLAATVFRGLGAMDYFRAKSIWVGLDIGCLALVLAMSWKLAGVRSVNGGLAAVAMCLLFHPLLALLERGQVELILFVAILIAVVCAQKEGTAWQIVSGLLLAACALFKLPLIYALPLLLLWRRWGIVTGFMIGAAGLSALSCFVNGRSALADYVQVQMPRISTYGQSAEPAAQLSRQTLERAIGQKLFHDGHDPVIVDGRTYRATSFDFGSNATLTVYLTRLKMFPTVTRASLVCYVIVAACVVLVLRRGLTQPPDASPDLMFWLMILGVILITGPLTWAMALVWLLPIPFVIAREIHRLEDTRHAFFLAVIAFGWLLIALPDSASFAVLFPFVKSVSTKYVAGEAIVLVGLSGYVRRKITRPESGISGAMPSS